MSTVKNSANTIKLAGVLKELPSFSMTSSWEKGPASSISDTIKEYLNRNIKNYDLILINWMVMTDNDLIYDDGRPLIERFTKPLNPKGCATICTHNHFLPENWI